MPIATHKVTQAAQKVIQPTITPPDYKGIVNDTAIKPVEALLSYISGASWTVDYYGQVLGEHNNLRELDANSPEIYQSYNKTAGLEIRVSSPLSSSYDADTTITTYSGSGKIYPFLVPNASDYFITDAGDTRKGIFRVTNVERLSVNRDSVFNVEYELVAYIDTRKDLYEALEARSTGKYHYDKDRLTTGANPVLRSETYELISDTKKKYAKILSYYFRIFYNLRVQTFLLPFSSKSVYDPYLTVFLNKIIDTSETENMVYMKTPDYDNDPIANQLQFWEILIKRDHSLLDEAVSKMQFVSRMLFSRNPHLKGLYFSGMDFITYPLLSDESMNSAYAIKAGSDVELLKIERKHRQMLQIPNYQYITANKTLVTIPEIDFSKSYVLGESFYSLADNELSIIEILTKDYLLQQSIDLGMLNRLCDDYSKWERMEQFYFGPILMLLCKTVIHEAY